MADIKELTVGGTTYKIKDEVCRTNILYAINTGVKNILPVNVNALKAINSNGSWTENSYLYNGVRYTVNADGSITITRVSSSSSDSTFNLEMSVGNKYVGYYLSGGSDYCAIIMLTSGGNTALAVRTIASAVPSNATGNMNLYVRSSDNPDNNTVYPMISYMNDSDYMPFARPNYDLTVREQQDRNALVEVVDKGAKNKLDFSNSTIVREQYTTTTKSNDNLVVACTGAVWAFASLAAGKFTGNSTFTFIISELSNSGASPYVRFTKNQDGSSPILDIAVVANGTYTANFVGDGSDYYICIYLNPSATSQTVSLKMSDIMVCDTSEYNVSPTVTPFALPNTDLTRMMTPFFTVPINHNMIYRGANLGDTLTADQDTALSSGNFTDLYLGDYWTKQITIPAFYEVTTAEPADWSTNYTSYYTKSGDTYTPVSGDTAPTWAANTYYERLVPAQTVTLKAVIADFDTFYAGYASGYAAINTHHAAVIVTGFSNVVWNKTNSTAGGYVASLIHKWLVGSALPQIETWFGSAKVLSHQKLLTNAITGDAASGWAWSSQKIALLSENQMYGSKVWGGSKATNGGYEPGEAFKHLNVFNHIDANIWLRDIASAGKAACLYNGGYADDSDASFTGIAPSALILLS